VLRNWVSNFSSYLVHCSWEEDDLRISTIPFSISQTVGRIGSSAWMPRPSSLHMCVVLARFPARLSALRSNMRILRFLRANVGTVPPIASTIPSPLSSQDYCRIPCYTAIQLKYISAEKKINVIALLCTSTSDALLLLITSAPYSVILRD
jgi:hypothetical protein